MSTNAHLTKGTLFKRGDGGGPEVFTTVAECKSLDLKMSVEMKDVSDLESLAREFKAVFIDPGTLDVELQFRSDNAGHVALWDDFQAMTAHNYQIVDTASPAKTLAFNASIQEFDLSHPVGDVRTAKLIFKLSGLPTLS